MRFSRFWRNVAHHSAAIAVVLAVIVLSALVAEACPTCKNGIAGDAEKQRRIAAGYYYSILFMMSMPFLLLGSFGTYAYFTVRRARNEQAKEDEASGGQAGEA